MIYHRLGQKFLSPTVNLCFPDKKEYVRFVKNLKYYLSLELRFVESDLPYPVAYCGDVKILFNHYKTEQEAREKWVERSKRVNYDNLYIIADEAANFSYEEIEALNHIACANKCVLSLQEYPEFDFVVPLLKYKGATHLGIYMEEKNPFTGLYPFDLDFDYVAWLNNEDFRRRRTKK